MSSLHNFSVLCGVSLILLAAAPQPAAAQDDPCAPYANNAPYYQRCLQIQEQSARIRAQQEQQSKRAAEVREERLDRFYDPEKQQSAPKTRSKKDARAAAYEKIAPVKAETEKPATIPVGTTATQTGSTAAQPATAAPAQTDSAPTPAIQGAGYIVIDPAKLTPEQLQAIMTILKQSAPQANLSGSLPSLAAAPATPVMQGELPAAALDAPQPFSQDYPPVAGREGTTAVTLPDVGQGGQEIMEIEPVDPASLHMRP